MRTFLMKEATKKLLSFFLIQKVSEANSLPKPHTDEPVGFGFSPSPPNDPDPSLDRTPPASDNLDHLTTDEELQNQEMANRELQILQLITEEIENQLAIDDWIHNGGFEEKGTLGEELRYQQAFDEEFRNLVLEEMAGFSEYGRDRELDVEGEGRDERDDDDDDRSENGKEDENVGGESGLTVGSTDGRHRGFSYPVRPDAEDCSFYVRTGACKFGSNCKFNHPFRRRNQAAKENEESPERPAHADCKYFLSSGGCKYGKACRYKHSVRKTPIAPIAEFNFLGLPIRLGEKECPYYMRNGSCKYGLNCRFNHPDPTAVGGGDDLSGYGNGGSGSLQGASQSTMSSWSPPRALNETSPFVPVMFSPTEGAPSSYPERNGHQPGKDRAYPAPSERRLPTPPAFSLNSAADNNFYKHHKPPPMLIDEFPERPGQPVCSYFLKTGDCKYKSGCKFHHPKNRMPKTAASPMTVSDNGLPQRPDQNICSHYNRYGICKFGPACRFDHPLNFSSLSASPLPRFVGPGNHPPPYSNSATTDDGWDSWE